MNILAIGDIVGRQGCEFVRSHLPSFKQLKGIDLCIANGENSADGNGLTPVSAEYLLSSGIDVITTGNHVYRRREVYDLLDANASIVRPANFREENPGKGFTVIDKGRVRVAVINLMGTVYLEPLENPFYCMDRVLRQVGDCQIKIVDFHAEATSEKRAMGFYLDGRVSVLFGTHTHVQTADEQILKNGTGYITDLGMSGTIDSVLGVNPQIVIDKLRTAMPARFDNIGGACFICGCIFEVDDKTGKTVSVERVDIR